MKAEQFFEGWFMVYKIILNELLDAHYDNM